MPDVIETAVARHYETGALEARILEALTVMGKDPGALAPDDLKPVDEFHTGGLEATEALLAQLDLSGVRRAVDIGAGLGGTARLLASRHGIDVLGVDLTPEFVETARALSERVGLGARTRFAQGSALDLPAPDGGADLALLLHVGMNIPDKPGVLREAFRVLAPGGVFAIFDIMDMGGADGARYPLPWAERPETSFLAAPSVYRDAAAAAGFAPVAERPRGDFALDYFGRVFAAIEKAGGPPPLGIHLMMRETAGEKLSNYVANVEAGRIAPVEMIFRKPG